MTDAPPTAPPGSPALPRPVWAVAAVVYAAVAALFAVKYGARVPAGGALSLGYAAAAAAALWATLRLPAAWQRSGWTAAAVVAACAGVAAVGLAHVDPDALGVDRHLMIETVVENVRDGVYAYTPRYPNAPGPSPAYFALTAPFYLAGEVGWVTIAALAGFAVLAYRVLEAPRALLAVVLLAGALPFWYEVVTRSTLVANGVLAAALVWPMARASGGRALVSVAGWGALAGLLLSTRSVMALAVGAAALYAYGRPRRWGAGVLFGTAAAAVFAATILPLYLSDPVGFAAVNPFVIQTKLSSPLYTVLSVAVAAGVGLWAASPARLTAGVGLALALAVAMPFAETLAITGWAATVTRSGADIAYFTMAMPLLALALAAGPAGRPDPL